MTPPPPTLLFRQPDENARSPRQHGQAGNNERKDRALFVSHRIRSEQIQDDSEATR